jgi:hypothetical protein
MQDHLCVIESQGSLALISRAHVLLAETYLRTLTGGQLPPFLPDIEHSLAKAVPSKTGAKKLPRSRWSLSNSCSKSAAVVLFSCGSG